MHKIKENKMGIFYLSNGMVVTGTVLRTDDETIVLGNTMRQAALPDGGLTLQGMVDDTLYVPQAQIVAWHSPKVGAPCEKAYQAFVQEKRLQESGIVLSSSMPQPAKQ